MQLSFIVSSLKLPFYPTASSSKEEEEEELCLTPQDSSTRGLGARGGGVFVSPAHWPREITLPGPERRGAAGQPSRAHSGSVSVPFRKVLLESEPARPPKASTLSQHEA